MGGNGEDTQTDTQVDDVNMDDSQAESITGGDTQVDEPTQDRNAQLDQMDENEVGFRIQVGLSTMC